MFTILKTKSIHLVPPALPVVIVRLWIRVFWLPPVVYLVAGVGGVPQGVLHHIPQPGGGPGGGYGTGGAVASVDQTNLVFERSRHQLEID